MPGLLIVAHAPLASALKAVGQHAFPEVAHRSEAVDVPPEMSLEDIERSIREALARVRNPDALILTDVFGATPFNVAQRVAGQVGAAPGGPQVKVLAGINVPMLWRSLACLDAPLDDLIAGAAVGAVRGVMQSSSSRPQNQAQKTGGNDQDPNKNQQ